MLFISLLFYFILLTIISAMLAALQEKIPYIINYACYFIVAFIDAYTSMTDKETGAKANEKYKYTCLNARTT